MRLFGFGDHSDYQLVVKPSKSRPGLWHWLIKDGAGFLRAMPPVHGKDRGFDTEEAAIEDARQVVNGLGADFKDLDIVEE